MREYYIAKGEERIGPFTAKEMEQEIFYKNTKVWKESWKDWKMASDVPELLHLINSEPPPIKNENSKQNNYQSIIDKAYTKIGAYIDKYFIDNKQKIDNNKFYSKLKDLRGTYSTLSAKKKRGITFFISIMVIFFVLSLMMWSFNSGYNITKFWIAFIALNQVKFIANIVNSIVRFIIFIVLMFLPEFLREIASRFGTNISFIIGVYFFSGIIAPIYIIYRLGVILMDFYSDSASPKLSTK